MRVHLRTTSLWLVTLGALALFAGCDEADDEPESPGGASAERPLQCDSDGYVAFDAANYSNQLLRVQAHAEIAGSLKAAIAVEPFDATGVRAAFAAAKATYEDTASLREKVQGRGDDHFEDSPNVGAELDATIMEWLAVGEAAEDALTATLARQWVDKTLIHFFFLSVYHELVAGKTDKWDEAFGYFGAPVDNAEGDRAGLAGVATKRDATNGTALAAEAYNGLLEGSCALALGLEAAGAESLDWREVPAVKSAVESVDLVMQEALAYSVAHEAFEMAELQETLAATPDDAEASAEMWIKLAELDPYFRPIEALMTAAGGASATRAAEIRAALDAAWAGWEARDGSWMGSFDAAGIVERLEAEYSIDVKG